MMKSKNILEQEKEFLKLNAEIDFKTKELMSQVDQIKEIQLNNEDLMWDNFGPSARSEYKVEDHLEEGSFGESFAANGYFLRRSEDEGSSDAIDSKKERSKKDAKSPHAAKVSHSLVGVQGHESMFSLGIIRHKSDVKLKQAKVESDAVPETLKGVGHDGIVKFLSAKVKLLTEQLQAMQKDERKYLEKIKELQVHKDKSVEERDKLIQQANMNKNMLVKLEQHINNLAGQLQAAQTEKTHLKKELETLKREVRQSSKTHNAQEVKLNRSLEEVEKLKATMQQMKQEDKEFKEVQRKKTEDLLNTIKNLDRQRSELLNGFKKQLLIIDNLKRQRGLLEAGKLLKSAQDNFMNYLDCNPPRTVRHTEAIKSAKS